MGTMWPLNANNWPTPVTFVGHKCYWHCCYCWMATMLANVAAVVATVFHCNYFADSMMNNAIVEDYFVNALALICHSFVLLAD